MMERSPVRPRSLALLVALALVGGCSSAKAERERPPPLVQAAPAARQLFVDVMAVVRGQLLAVLSQAQETAQLNGALAAEQQATAQYDRISQLFERGFATRAQLDLQLAAAERARADAAQARAAIGDRMIRAPFAGRTGLRTLSAGAVVQAGTPLVTVSDISRIKLDFTVPETQLAALTIGQEIEASAAAFPGETF